MTCHQFNNDKSSDLARKLNNLNRPGQAQMLMGQARVQAKLYPKFAYNTSNYEKAMYAISFNFSLIPGLFL